MLTNQTYTYWRSTATSLARVVIVTSLLVNIALPFLDHHYVERQPAHDHIYFKGFTPHTHQFEQAQHHHPVSTVSRILLRVVVLDPRDISHSHSHTLPSERLSLSDNSPKSSYPLLIADYINTNIPRSGTTTFPDHPPPKL